MARALLDEHLGDLVRRGLAGIDQTSSIVASLGGDVMHDEEAAALNAALAGAHEAYQELEKLVSANDDQLLFEVEAVFADALRAVDAELDAAGEGTPVARGIAATMLDSLNGSQAEEFIARVAPWPPVPNGTFNPGGAWERVSEALSLPAGIDEQGDYPAQDPDEGR